MSDPSTISIHDYRYELPDEKIAKFPLTERDHSKLLFWKNNQISDRHFRELPELLEGDLLLLNNTKVIEARLYFKTSTGADIEIFLLSPEKDADPVTALTQKKSARWKCMIGRLARWKNESLVLEKDEVKLQATKIEITGGAGIIEFTWNPGEMVFAEIIRFFGNVPLPPYLNREPIAQDINRYQTVYAIHPGSVAAPTAGLHFTETVEDALKQKGIRQEYVTLHVGAGTFKPVTSDTLAGHAMHSELIDVPLELIQQLSNQDPDKTTAVGTTTLRTLESLYWLSQQLQKHTTLSIEEVEIDQWYPYHYPSEDSFQVRMQWLAIYLESRNKKNALFRSRLLIAPGYTVRSCGGLITNFHQPSSTLLLLVAAVTMNNWKEIYAHALQHDYRFLSYGDSSYLRFGSGK